MQQAPLRKPKAGPHLPGPTLIRLLARLAGADVAPAGSSLPDRLSQWFDWNQALVLSTALDGKLAVVASDLPLSSEVESDECARVRASLAANITADDGVQAADDYAAFRQRHLTLQRSMQAATGRLRGHLRDRLAQTSDEMARLAEVDAVMELALSPREQNLLATVPALLGEHFERLRQIAQTQERHAVTVTSTWLERFRHDMQSVLLAELDVRFQPVEGLLAALRTSAAGSHVQKSA
ncbi:DUF3348 domain-containing protein [Rhodanobacter sp. AS-Z3]|uniref:DUF3348 domain-containing protein n=1 Tax=Rhodanobacter sp. AS-Z3 TaxID=3031330 RepID=UPI0024792335|nr:DUF3348 domain-containing protein [Rhodanobacter sp. AS-Z3]WEN16742.1 DUF3348 domain-containing protein [Rhodanobacter sp. AS-Z3]